MKTVLPHALAIVLAAVPSLAADDKDADTKGVKSQKVEVTVRRSTTQDSEDAKPKSEVRGRIVIEGPDGQRQEYKLGDKLPEGWKLNINSVSGPHGTFRLDGQRIAEDTEPRLMIGVVCTPASEALQSHLKLGEHGLLVTQVSDGLPAGEAGIQRNDLLLSIGETKLRTLKDLVDTISGSDGKELEIMTLHAGEEVTVKVTPKKMTNKEAMEALGSSAAGSADGQRWETEVFRARPGDRNYLMAPGLRLENGEDVDVRKMFNEARSQALRNLREAAKSDSATASELRQQVRQLNKQVAELQQRLQVLEDR